MAVLLRDVKHSHSQPLASPYIKSKICMCYTHTKRHNLIFSRRIAAATNYSCHQPLTHTNISFLPIEYLTSTSGRNTFLTKTFIQKVVNQLHLTPPSIKFIVGEASITNSKTYGIIFVKPTKWSHVVAKRTIQSEISPLALNLYYQALSLITFINAVPKAIPIRSLSETSSPGKVNTSHNPTFKPRSNIFSSKSHFRLLRLHSSTHISSSLVLIVSKKANCALLIRSDRVVVKSPIQSETSHPTLNLQDRTPLRSAFSHIELKVIQWRSG